MAKAQHGLVDGAGQLAGGSAMSMTSLRSYGPVPFGVPLEFPVMLSTPKRVAADGTTEPMLNQADIVKLRSARKGDDCDDSELPLPRVTLPPIGPAPPAVAVPVIEAVLTAPVTSLNDVAPLVSSKRHHNDGPFVAGP